MSSSNHPPQAASLDLVVPCYNPAQNWASTLSKNFDILQRLLPEVTIHLILVNDGSVRGIDPADIHHLEKQIPHFTYLTYPTNQGKGFALRTGVAKSTSPYCLYTDIDFPYLEESIANIYQVLTKGGIDIAVGVRDADYYSHVPASRTRISKLLKALTRNLLRIPITDTQCGLKGFTAEGKKTFLQTKINRYLFDLEFIFLASKKSTFSLRPVVVQLKPGIVFSTMNSRILASEGYSFLKILMSNLTRSA